jgi:hypothetical protein
MPLRIDHRGKTLPPTLYREVIVALPGVCQQPGEAWEREQETELGTALLCEHGLVIGARLRNVRVGEAQMVAERVAEHVKGNLE